MVQDKKAALSRKRYIPLVSELLWVWGVLREAVRRWLFLRQYRRGYRKEYAGWIGAELELVLIQPAVNGTPQKYLPRAHEVLAKLTELFPSLAKYFDCEFWAGQLEVRTDPQPTVDKMVCQLLGLADLARWVAKFWFGWELIAKEWIPWEEDVPYELSPLKPRYAEYAKKHAQKVPAMCRVGALQFHRGMPDLLEAMCAYNRVARGLRALVDEGWIDQGRLQAFEEAIFPGWLPPVYLEPTDIYLHAIDRGFVDRPGGNYSAVRIHPKHGTVEIRLGGATTDPEVIKARATRFLEIAGVDAR